MRGGTHGAAGEKVQDTSPAEMTFHVGLRSSRLTRAWILGVLVAIGLLACPNVAVADSCATLTGSWSAVDTPSNGVPVPQTWDLTQSGTTLTGTGSGGGHTWTITGSVSGSMFTMHHVYNDV